MPTAKLLAPGRFDSPVQQAEEEVNLLFVQAVDCLAGVTTLVIGFTKRMVGEGLDHITFTYMAFVTKLFYATQFSLQSL